MHKGDKGKKLVSSRFGKALDKLSPTIGAPVDRYQFESSSQDVNSILDADPTRWQNMGAIITPDFFGEARTYRLVDTIPLSSGTPEIIHEQLFSPKQHAIIVYTDRGRLQHLENTFDPAFSVLREAIRASQSTNIPMDFSELDKIVLNTRLSPQGHRICRVIYYDRLTGGKIVDPNSDILPVVTFQKSKKETRLGREVDYFGALLSIPEIARWNEILAENSNVFGGKDIVKISLLFTKKVPHTSDEVGFPVGEWIIKLDLSSPETDELDHEVRQELALLKTLARGKFVADEALISSAHPPHEVESHIEFGPAGRYTRRIYNDVTLSDGFQRDLGPILDKTGAPRDTDGVCIIDTYTSNKVEVEEEEGKKELEHVHLYSHVVIPKHGVLMRILAETELDPIKPQVGGSRLEFNQWKTAVKGAKLEKSNLRLKYIVEWNSEDSDFKLIAHKIFKEKQIELNSAPSHTISLRFDTIVRTEHAMLQSLIGCEPVRRSIELLNNHSETFGKTTVKQIDLFVERVDEEEDAISFLDACEWSFVLTTSAARV
ncbi:hypothetical protein ABW19_dt0205988 [Dactylella cylindrospora]|nr:hypothetical protein ABW19_dt0205988 [Dactylella cylindrospora]